MMSKFLNGSPLASSEITPPNMSLAVLYQFSGAGIGGYRNFNGSRGGRVLLFDHNWRRLDMSRCGDSQMAPLCPISFEGFQPYRWLSPYGGSIAK
jgi:hypothetical protein